MRKFQIGVMGSMADLKYNKQLESIAYETGVKIAENDAILVFGAEKDSDSLSTVASRGAKSKNGLTVGITYGKAKGIVQNDTDIIIPTGLDRGGGREYVLALSCDVLIVIGGGSGTLNEIVVAYQADIPIVAVENTGGWAEKLTGMYLDDRNRRKILSAGSPASAVKTAIAEAVKYRSKYEQDNINF